MLLPCNFKLGSGFLYYSHCFSGGVMRRLLSISVWMFLACSVLFFSGCKEKNPLGAAFVTGTVTLDGNPIPWASVTFYPKSESLPLASGKSNEKGIYLLTPVGGIGGEGALEGDYLVTLSKSDISEAEMYDLGGTSIGASSTSGITTKKQPGDVFPQKYTKAKTSGFDVKVVKGKKNQLDFACVSDK